MNGFIRRHISEFVSLTVLLLMAVALIGGPADATLSSEARGLEPPPDAAFTARLNAALETAGVRARLVIDVEHVRSDDLAAAGEAATELLTISLLGGE